MFTTDLANLYNRNIFKTSLCIHIFQDEKCRLIRNLSLSMGFSIKNTGVNRALSSPKGGLLELFIFDIDDSFVKKNEYFTLL